MLLNLTGELLNKVIMVGDRILIRPTSDTEQTDSGLFLPPGVMEHEKIRTGYVMKVGPGYPVPAMEDENEAWKNRDSDARYVPLQPRTGDLVVFLQKQGWEIEFDKQKYIIVPQSAVLLLFRDEGFWE